MDVCEQRDRKGLYAKARAGILKEFTGISDPYEEPTDAEVRINTAELSPEEAAQEIVLHLEREGFIGMNRNRPNESDRKPSPSLANLLASDVSGCMGGHAHGWRRCTRYIPSGPVLLGSSDPQ